ncbi:21594_t:CDS:2, partial [Racocetra persica]
RRVVIKLAVPDLLAKDLAESVNILGLSCVFESHKTHHRNWANPRKILFGKREELIKKMASVMSEGQKTNPQFPPSHSPAVSRGILKEEKSNDSGSTASSASAPGSGSNTSTASLQKK